MILYARQKRASLHLKIIQSVSFNHQTGTTIEIKTRKQVEMLKQHEIQKSHVRENVLYDVIMRRSTRNTRLRISRFSCIRTSYSTMTFKLSLRFCLFNKSELYSFTFDFFPRWINSGWGRQSSKLNHHHLKTDSLSQTLVTGGGGGGHTIITPPPPPPPE